MDECSWRWSLAAGSASPENFRNQMYSSWRVKQPKQQECKWRSLFLSEFRRVRTESHNPKRVYVQTWLKPDPVSWGQNLTAPCWSTEWEYTLRAEVSTPDVLSKINLKMRGDGHVGADDVYWTKRCVFTTLNYILSSLQQTATFWENTEFDECKPKIPKWLVSHRGPRVFISSKKNSHEGNRRGRGFTSVRWVIRVHSV